MATDELPGEIVTLTRDEFRNLFTQDYQLFAPNAEVGPGTQPYVDGSLAADATLVIVNDAVTIGAETWRVLYARKIDDGRIWRCRLSRSTR